jgi:hypothetical protein
VAYWKNWQRQPPRAFKDVELSDADAVRYSLVLVGGPDANLIARKLAGKIPLKVSSDRVKIGPHAFQAADARIEMIYPNPLNAQRYVMVIAATSADGLFFMTPEELGSADYDFIVRDSHMPAGPERTSAADLAVAAGWFDRRWQIDNTLLHPGNTELRAKSVLLHAPKPGRTVDPRILDSYAGRYQLAPNAVVHIERKENRLTAHVGDQPAVELLPVSDTEFFVLEGPVQILFVNDASGKTVSLKGWQNGQAFQAKKIE